jgi:RNA polymerase sigma-70 factor (ECF subfamily)
VDDEELLRRCQRGEDSALTILVQRYQDRIFRLAFRVLRDAARAEDAAADALSTVWARCRSWRGEAAAGTWIHQVAWRVILDHARSRRRWWRFWELTETQTELTSSQLDPSVVIAEQAENADRRQRVSNVLDLLSAEDRALIHMHYFEEQSLAEIAAILGASRDALKVRLSRLRQKLRGLLGDSDADA